MYITWLGHSCFRLESAGYGLVIDPYRVVAGYPPLRVEANAVYISHHHFDHDCLEAVTLLPGGENPFTVETFSTFHDDCQGALRGDNTVHIFRAEGMTVVHLGDLGCALTAAQEEKISGCDALMLPVGGTYTIDAAAAAELVRRLHPRLVLPMHFRRGEQGFPELTTLEDFLSRLPGAAGTPTDGGDAGSDVQRDVGCCDLPPSVRENSGPGFVRKMSKNQSRYKPLRFRVH